MRVKEGSINDYGDYGDYGGMTGTVAVIELKRMLWT